MRTLAILAIALAGVVGPLSAVYGATATLTAPRGGSTVAGGLSITVDPYGAFSSAVFKPTTGISAANTIRYSSIMLNTTSYGREFLDQDWRGTISFGSTTANQAVSSFSFGNLQIDLTQTVEDHGPGARLTQVYDVGNLGTSSQTLSFTRYVDGDLLFNGNDSDGGASSTAPTTVGENLYMFDSIVSGSTLTPYVGLFITGGLRPTNFYEIDEYWNLFGKVDAGTTLDNTVANASGGMVNSAYDLAAAMVRSTVIPAEDGMQITFITDFSYGRPTDIRAATVNQTLMVGDTDLDEDVDFSDLGTLISNYNATGGWCDGNFTSDTMVTFDDLGMLISNYGAGASSQVPEPATVALLAMGAMGMLRRRR